MLGSHVALNLSREYFDAVLFDLDGVLTQTAKVHARCWKETFDGYLAKRGEKRGERFEPFDIDADYRKYVDGRPRYDGCRAFLASRAIQLPEGTPKSPPSEESVCGLANRKSGLFQALLRRDGVDAYGGSVRFAQHVLDQGLHSAVVSSSHNCEAILEAAHLRDLFELVVDGNLVAREHLRGKPAPDAFIEATRLMHVEPRRSVVVEDAISGVEAGQSGGFGLVIGVDRRGDPRSLLDHGADVVVGDLDELLPRGRH